MTKITMDGNLGKPTRDQPSDVATIRIEIGPLTCYGKNRREARQNMTQLKNDLDLWVKRYMAVGPYSKAVRTTLR